MTCKGHSQPDQKNQAPNALLSFKDLSVTFHGLEGASLVLEKVNLDIMPAEILGLVGESGCGKSVLARATLRLLPQPQAELSGEILFRDENLLGIDKKRLRQIRGGEISMIFQEPMTSLNPVFTVGRQMGEVVRLHMGVSKAEARRRCEDMLRAVNMPDPEGTFAKYPHELSGGMRQRVMIAMEMSCNPVLLIADEPTTALDVTVQGQVLALLSDMTRSRGVSTLFITHDMGVVAQLCERVAVMYAGKLVELVTVAELFHNPLHPYSQGLIAAIPTLSDKRKELPSIPGTVPNFLHPPQGCRFHPRCKNSAEICRQEVPPLLAYGAHHVACHRVFEANGARP